MSLVEPAALATAVVPVYGRRGGLAVLGHSWCVVAAKQVWRRTIDRFASPVIEPQFIVLSGGGDQHGRVLGRSIIAALDDGFALLGLGVMVPEWLPKPVAIQS